MKKTHSIRSASCGAHKLDSRLRGNDNFFSVSLIGNQGQRTLESLYLKGLLVSIDAMGCQRDIAAQIHRAVADSREQLWPASGANGAGDSGRRAYRHDGLASVQEYRRDRFVAAGGRQAGTMGTALLHQFARSGW